MSELLRVAFPPPKPLLIYDGDCRLCRRWIARWERWTGPAVEYLPYQDPVVAGRFPELSRERCAEAAQFIDRNGRVFEAAEGVLRALACAPSKRWPLWIYARLPGAAFLAERAYRLVARHRDFLSRW